MSAPAPETLAHPFPPFLPPDARVLILGSFPSRASRAQGFYYGHPRNRFYPVLAALFGTAVPQDTAEKQALLAAHGVALWDVAAACTLCGSADSSIRSVRPNDLRPLLSACPIRRLFTNGHTAARLYDRLLRPLVAPLVGKRGIALESADALCLPSTSPANAAASVSALTEAWRAILPALRP